MCSHLMYFSSYILISLPILLCTSVMGRQSTQNGNLRLTLRSLLMGNTINPVKKNNKWSYYMNMTLISLCWLGICKYYLLHFATIEHFITISSISITLSYPPSWGACHIIEHTKEVSSSLAQPHTMPQVILIRDQSLDKM